MSDEPLFSQRMGIKPMKKEIQIKSMNEELRIGLWNGLTTYYWSQVGHSNGQDYANTNPRLAEFVKNLWINFWKYRLDQLDTYWWSVIKEQIDEYFFKAEWNESYDLLQFIVKNFKVDETVKTNFINYCNNILEKEFSAYRFVGDLITPITSQAEIAEITQALNTPLSPVTEHLESALALLSNKENPDYRNSIKESISAVEFICKKIVNKNDTTLGIALNELQTTGKIFINPDMAEAFKKLYHYTSDADGIRHAMMNSSNADFDDAKFMLVSCSAFVNYIISRATKSGIQLK